MANAIVLRTKAEVEELEIMMHGTLEQCESYLFKHITPNKDDAKNLTRLESNEGCLYSVELLRNNVWREYKYLLMPLGKD